MPAFSPNSGNPEAVGYQPIQIPPWLGKLLASGGDGPDPMESFSKPLFGGLNSAIGQIPRMQQNNKLNALMKALQQRRQNGQQPQQPQQGGMPQMPQMGGGNPDPLGIMQSSSYMNPMQGMMG